VFVQGLQCVAGIVGSPHIRTDHITLVLHTAPYHKNRATQSIKLVLCIPNMMHSQYQTLAIATDFYILDLD